MNGAIAIKIYKTNTNTQIICGVSNIEKPYQSIGGDHIIVINRVWTTSGNATNIYNGNDCTFSTSDLTPTIVIEYSNPIHSRYGITFRLQNLVSVDFTKAEIFIADTPTSTFRLQRVLYPYTYSNTYSYILVSDKYTPISTTTFDVNNASVFPSTYNAGLTVTYNSSLDNITRYIYVKSDAYQTTNVIPRQANTAYSVGDIRRKTGTQGSQDSYFICTTAGTSNSNTTFLDSYAQSKTYSLADGGVTWQTCNGTASGKWNTAYSDSLSATFIPYNDHSDYNKLTGTAVFIFASTGTYNYLPTNQQSIFKYLVSVDPASGGTSTYQKGAVFNLYYNSNFFPSTSGMYVAGFIFNVYEYFVLPAHFWVYDCDINVIGFSLSVTQSNKYEKCSINFVNPIPIYIGNTGHTIFSNTIFNVPGARLRNLLSGDTVGTSGTNVYHYNFSNSDSHNSSKVSFIGVDLSIFDACCTLVEWHTSASLDIVFIGCILPSCDLIYSGLNPRMLDYTFECIGSNIAGITDEFSYKIISDGYTLEKVTNVYRNNGGLDEAQNKYSYKIEGAKKLIPFYEFAKIKLELTQEIGIGVYNVVLHGLGYNVSNEDFWVDILYPLTKMKMPDKLNIVSSTGSLNPLSIISPNATTIDQDYTITMTDSRYGTLSGNTLGVIGSIDTVVSYNNLFIFSNLTDGHCSAGDTITFSTYAITKIDTGMFSSKKTMLDTIEIYPADNESWSIASDSFKIETIITVNTPTHIKVIMYISKHISINICPFVTLTRVN